MTENEAINELLDYVGDAFKTTISVEAVTLAREALEEIQQYRAMEEKLNGISVERVVNGFINVTEKGTDEGYERGRILTNAEADMWNEYRAIGTVEELLEFKEKKQNKCKDCAGCTSWLCECANERGEAIDEFAEALKKEISFKYGSGQINRAYNAKEKTLKLIDEIAEQMKAGAE